MAVRDKYEDNKRFFESCGGQNIFLPFDEIKKKLILPNWVLEDVTANRAWANTTIVQSFGASWRSSGYRAKLDKAKGGVWFIRDDDATKFAVGISTSIGRTRQESTLSIDMAITKIRKFHDTTIDGEHTRYRSWAHCFKAFRELRHVKDNIDLLCLHLAWYMASWGMLRGGSFLLQMDYLVHKPLVETVLSSKYEALFINKHEPKTIPLILDFAKEIRKAYGQRPLTDTFITKIILGIFGTAPAYDRYFKYAARKYSVCSGTFNENSMQALWGFYGQHQNAFDGLRNSLTVEGIRYTPMKMLDMCLFQIGLDELGENEKEG